MDISIAVGLETLTPAPVEELPPLPDARSTEILALWKTRVLHTCDILQHRAMKIEEGRELGYNDHVSLVQYTEELIGPGGASSKRPSTATDQVHAVNFINWQDPNKLIGQPIFVDLNTNKLKFSMHTCYPYRALRDAIIIIPECGVSSPRRQSLHVAKTVRPSIDVVYLELQALWYSMLRNLGPGRWNDIEMCVICGRSTKPGVAAGAASSSADRPSHSPAERTFTCSLCGLVWHASCCEGLRRTVGKCRDIDPPLLPEFCIGAPTDIACSLCRRQL